MKKWTLNDIFLIIIIFIAITGLSFFFLWDNISKNETLVVFGSLSIGLFSTIFYYLLIDSIISITFHFISFFRKNSNFSQIPQKAEKADIITDQSSSMEKLAKESLFNSSILLEFCKIVNGSATKKIDDIEFMSTISSPSSSLKKIEVEEITKTLYAFKLLSKQINNHSERTKWLGEINKVFNNNISINKNRINKINGYMDNDEFYKSINTLLNNRLDKVK